MFQSMSGVPGLNVLNTSLQPSWKFRFPSLPGFLSHQLLQAMPMLCLCWQCRASWAGFELASEIEVVLPSQHNTAPSQGTATSSCTYLLLRGDEWFHPVQCNDISALILEPLIYEEGTQLLMVWNIVVLLKSALKSLNGMMFTCPKPLHRPQCLGAPPCDYLVVTF